MPLSALNLDTAKTTLSPATRIVTLPGPLTLHRGGILSKVEIAYETWGELNADKSNVVLLFTGLSPSAHAASSPQDEAAGWWEAMIGPHKPIDTERFHVVCVNSLGSCYGSTGPASIDPQTNKPYRLAFPELTVEDSALAAREVLRLLDIPRPKAVIGASMGGMTALAYGLLFPGEAQSLVLISAAAHSLPFAIAMRSLQREIIRSDPTWQGGNYAPGHGPLAGMRLARKLGVTTYRSPGEWRERFGRKRVVSEGERRDAFSTEFEVESYLEHHARKFTGQFDANCYLYLSRAMDWFDVADYGESVAGALANLVLERALVIGVQSDILFPLAQQEELVEGLRAGGVDVMYAPLKSPQGHDAFLVDFERFAPVMRDFFASL